MTFSANKTRRLLLSVLFISVFLVYLPTTFHAFVYDDMHQVLLNPWIKDIAHIGDIFFSPLWSFKEGGEGITNYYRPMMHMVFMAQYYLFGLSPWAFHLVNSALHALNAILVFLVASNLFSYGPSGVSEDSTSATLHESIHKSLFCRNSRWAFLAAMLFALHPVNSEVVNWVSAIPELTYTFFFLAAFYLYMPRPDRAIVLHGYGRRVLSIVCFFLALLSKETAMALIPIIFLYGSFFRREGVRRFGGLIQYIPFIVIALLYLFLRSYSFSSIAIEKKLDIGLYEAMLAVLPLLSAYFGKLLLPLTLNALYSYYKISSIYDMRVIFSCFVLAGYLLLLFFTWRFKIVPFLLLWIVIPLAPVLYIPVLTGAPFAERYLYLPSVGFAILCAYSIMKIVRLGAREGGGKGKIFIVAPLVIVAALLTFYLVKVETRITVWKSELTLWSDTVKKSPQSSTAHFNLGWTYQREHDNEKAEASYLESIRLAPRAVDAHYNLGRIYMLEGRYLEASKEFGIVMKIDSRYRKVRKYMERAGAKIKR